MPGPYEGEFPPYVRGSGTSYAAAASVRSKSAAMRHQIIALLEERGGLTCDEVEVILELRHQTASARFAELRRDGLISKVGERPTRSGRKADVMAVGVSDPPVILDPTMAEGYWD